MAKPPRLLGGVDLTGLRLTATDAFLISRIDGDTAAEDLCHLVGQDEQQLMETLYRLERMGVLHWSGNPSPTPASSQKPTPSDSRAASDLLERELASIDLSCLDLDRDTLGDILAMEQRLSMTHWHALGLSGNPVRGDIKRAFFKLSKKYHPDRYFGKNIGPYKQRLDRIFAGLKRAYDTLSDPKKREAYEIKNPPPGTSPRLPSGDVHTVPVTKTVDPALEARLEARRRQILEQRRASGFGRQGMRMKPAAGKASGFYNDGLEQLRSGDSIGAEASFKLALAHDPDNHEYQTRYADAAAQAGIFRAKKRVNDAAKKEQIGDVLGAAEDWANASDLVTANTRYALRAAECFLELREPERAWTFAERALASAGDRGDVHIVAAASLLMGGRANEARPHVERAQALEPGDPRVKKLLERMPRQR